MMSMTCHCDISLELFLRLRDMLYEWLSVILRLFVLYLMFACNGDGSL